MFLKSFSNHSNLHVLQVHSKEDSQQVLPYWLSVEKSTNDFPGDDDVFFDDNDFEPEIEENVEKNESQKEAPPPTRRSNRTTAGEPPSHLLNYYLYNAKWIDGKEHNLTGSYTTTV